MATSTHQHMQRRRVGRRRAKTPAAWRAHVGQPRWWGLIDWSGDLTQDGWLFQFTEDILDVNLGDAGRCT